MKDALGEDESMTDSHQRDVARLIRALDQTIRDRGRGALSAMHRELGYSAGWWQGRMASGDVTVGQLLQMLEHLGLEPAKFVRRALGDDDGFEFDRPPGEPPALIAQAWARLRVSAEGEVGLGFLNTLDQRKYEQPAEVLEQAHWAIDHVELALVPRVLGVAGAAWRLLIQLDSAMHAIQAGIEIARQADNRVELGRLLRRLAYVTADRGDRNEALQISEKAGTILLRCGETLAFGETLVDQGTWLYYLSRYRDAINTFDLALERIPPRSSRSYRQGLQVAGLCFQALGDTKAALACVLRAEQDMRETNLGDKGKLLWLRARILLDIGKVNQAVEVFARVIEIFRELHHGEAAIATCEMVRAQLTAGQYREAYETAASMRALVEPLSKNKIISSAIADLLRFGQAGLTLTLVEQVITQIQSERENRQRWRLLKKQP
ncbi:MAG: tetratricopeptide repeat protein [Acidobacteriota bacterium]